MELKKAIDTIREICKETELCSNCPLFIVGKGRLCDKTNINSDELSILEQKLIQWEKDHEKHYPTWRQWVRGQYPLGKDSMIVCPRRFFENAIDDKVCEYHVCIECYDSEISESAAKILGVEPIERKDD